MIQPSLFAAAFVVSALGGLAALLRSGRPLTRKAVASYTLNSGIVGLGIALVWFHRLRDELELLVGLCVVAGLGGMESVGVMREVGRRFIAALSRGKE
jgi:hypothetical protein